jgi:hypothetical protein
MIWDLVKRLLQKQLMLTSFGENLAASEVNEHLTSNEQGEGDLDRSDYDEIRKRLEENRSLELSDAEAEENIDQMLEEGFKYLEVDRDRDGVIDEFRMVPDLSHPRWNDDGGSEDR